MDSVCDFQRFVIETQENKLRLDVYLAMVTPYTRSYIKSLIDKGHVTVNGKNEKAGRALKSGDIVDVNVPADRECDLQPEDIPLDILYEDDSIAVINKPRGMVIHPGGGVYSGTLVNALLYRLGSLSTINGVIRPGIVHRLDKDTTGVMVVAKNDAAHLSLSSQIAQRTVVKKYVALLEGNLPEDKGNVTTYIDRNPKDRKLMSVCDSGRIAITDYEVLKRYKNNCLVSFIIHTGRTHQIRVHAKYLGYPVVGDASYGYKKQRFNLSGQLLHSKYLQFTHPVNGLRMEFEAPLPEDFRKILNLLDANESV